MSKRFSKADDVERYLIEELKFFERYYYETLNQKSQFGSTLQFAFTASIASFGYLGWITAKWSVISLFPCLNVIAVFALTSILIIIALNIYSFGLACYIFNKKSYRELPEASQIYAQLKKRNRIEKISYIIQKYHQCATHNTKISDERKKMISELFKIHTVNAGLIIITYLITIIGFMK